MNKLKEILKDMKVDKTPLMVYSIIDHNEFIYTRVDHIERNFLNGIDKKKYRNVELTFFLNIINSSLIDKLKEYISSDVDKMEIIRQHLIPKNSSLDNVLFLILVDINSIRMYIDRQLNELQDSKEKIDKYINNVNIEEETNEDLSNINSKIELYSRIDFNKDIFIPYIKTLIKNLEEINDLIQKFVSITKDRIKLEYLNSYNDNFVLPVSNITYLLEYNGLYYSKQNRNIREFIDIIPKITKELIENGSNYNELSVSKKEHTDEELKKYERITMERQSYKNKYVVMENFNIYNIYDLINLSLYLFYRDNLVILKCKNCNKLFIPKTRNSETLCDNIYKNGKTCKQLSSIIKLENDEIRKIYRNSYKLEHGKMKRYIENGTYRNNIEDKFNKWKINAQKKMNECENGKITIEEYREWIDENKKWYM